MTQNVEGAQQGTEWRGYNGRSDVHGAQKGRILRTWIPIAHRMEGVGSKTHARLLPLPLSHLCMSVICSSISFQLYKRFCKIVVNVHVCIGFFFTKMCVTYVYRIFRALIDLFPVSSAFSILGPWRRVGKHTVA
jgi:hypothetical protein